MRSCILILFVALSFYSEAQNNKFSNAVDSLVESASEKNSINGISVGFLDIKSGQQIFSNSGIAKPTSAQVDENTLFRIGSITKTFTAIAVLKLEEEGKLDLDRAVDEILPELKQIKKSRGFRAFTCRDLLTHTSGLRGEFNNALFISEPEDDCIYSDLLKDTLLISPGYVWAYSNTGYGLLGCVIERVSGKSYDEYLQSEIFVPFGMENTGLYGTKKEEEKMSLGFFDKGEAVVEAEIFDKAAGELVSNSKDLSLFLHIMLSGGTLRGKRVLSPSIIAKMQNDQIKNITLSTGDSFGYGLFISDFPIASSKEVGSSYGHGGDTRLFHSSFFYLPKIGVGISVLTNTENGAKVTNRLPVKILKTYLKDIKKMDVARVENTEFDFSAVSKSNVELAGEYGVGVGRITLKAKGKDKLRGKTDFKLPNLRLKEVSPGAYKVKAVLLGFIPIKIRDIRFFFDEVEGEIFLRQAAQGDKILDFIGKKRTNFQSFSEWTNYTGEYEVLNNQAPEWNLFPTSLKYENNLIYLTMTDMKGEVTQVLTFEPISGNCAVTNILGRGMGEYIKVLPTGNLYYSGFELQKNEK